MHIESIRLGQIRFSGIHRIDAVFLDGLLLLFGQTSRQHVHLGIVNLRLLLRLQNLNTLHCGVRSLVILSRQILHRKDKIRRIQSHLFFVYIIHRCLRKNAPNRTLIGALGQILQVVTMQNPNGRQPLQVQIVPQLF